MVEPWKSAGTTRVLAPSLAHKRNGGGGVRESNCACVWGGTGRRSVKARSVQPTAHTLAHESCNHEEVGAFRYSVGRPMGDQWHTVLGSLRACRLPSY